MLAVAACCVSVAYLLDLVAFAVAVVVVPQTGEAVVVAAAVAEDHAFGQNVGDLRQIAAVGTAQDVLAVGGRALFVEVLVIF